MTPSQKFRGPSSFIKYHLIPIIYLDAIQSQQRSCEIHINMRSHYSITLLVVMFGESDCILGHGTLDTHERGYSICIVYFLNTDFEFRLSRWGQKLDNFHC